MGWKYTVWLVVGRHVTWVPTGGGNIYYLLSSQHFRQTAATSQVFTNISFQVTATPNGWQAVTHAHCHVFLTHAHWLTHVRGWPRDVNGGINTRNLTLWRQLQPLTFDTSQTTKIDIIEKRSERECGATSWLMCDEQLLSLLSEKWNVTMKIVRATSQPSSHHGAVRFEALWIIFLLSLCRISFFFFCVTWLLECWQVRFLESCSTRPKIKSVKHRS